MSVEERGREPGAAPTAAQVREDVAAVLGMGPEEIGEEENLLDLGLDSVRLMALVQAWADRGAPVDFGALAERPVLGHWVELVAGAAGGAP